MKILSDVNVLAELQENGLDVAPLQSPALTGTPTAPTADSGTNTTQLATTAFVQAALSGVTTSSSAEKVTLQVRFGEAVSKGDPVYISGYHGSTGPVIMSKAKANDSAKMPAFGLADDDYAENATGYAVSIGVLEDVDTDSYTVGDTLYVAPTGGLTDTKPTGSNLIQNVGTVSRSNANNGSIEVTATGRSNDVPNLTTGKLWVGSANNTIESATLHLDETNNRLGIGTTSPNDKLEVNGNVRIQTSSGNSGIKVVTSNTAEGYLIFGDPEDNSMGGIAYNNSTNTLSIDSNNAERITIDSSGNVGIGTTTPGEKLEVNGKIKVNNEVIATKFVDYNNGNYYIDPANESIVNYIQAGLSSALYKTQLQSNALQFDRDGTSYINQVGTGNLAFRFGSGYTTRMTLTNDGKLGIGTTSPGSPLTVAGTIQSLPVSTTEGGDLRLRAATGLNYQYTIDNYSDTLRFIRQDDTTGSSGVVRMLIDSSGKVGIGTSTPTGRLNIVDDSTKGLEFEEITGGIMRMLAYDRTNSTYETLRLNASDLEFNISTSTAAVINSSGNVGIGTTSPAEKLHIDGGSIYVVDDGGNPRVVLGDNLSTGGYGQIQWNSSTDVLQLGSSLDADSLVINESGNVGIGTTSPDYNLNVEGSSGIGIGQSSSTHDLVLSNRANYANDTSNSHIWISSGSTGAFSGEGAHMVLETRRSARNIYFKVGDVTAPQHIMNYSGNVGIGTTSPSQKLQVNGNINTSELHLNDTDTKLLEGSNNAVRIQTNSGYIDVGPKNGAWGHIETDRGRFYFNKGVDVDGDIRPYSNNTTKIQGSTGYIFELGERVATRAVFEPGNSGGSRRFIRLFTLDGVANSTGASADVILSGAGDYGDFDRTALRIMAGERGNAVTVDVYQLNAEQTSDAPIIYWKTTGTNVFEIWAQLADYNQTHQLNILNKSGDVTINLDSITTTTPSSLNTVTQNTLWHSGNDGSGSGLDADTLDGSQATDFVAVTGDTMTGNLSIENGAPSLTLKDTTDSDDIRLYFKNNSDTIVGAITTAGNQLNIETSFTNGLEIDADKTFISGQTKIGSGLANARSTYGLTAGFTSNSTFSSNADVSDSNRTLSLVNESTTTNTYSTLSFRNSPSSGTSMADFKYVHRGTNSGDLIYTNNNGGTWSDQFSILSNGNVGIGTTSPSAKLDVAGGIKATGNIESDANILIDGNLYLNQDNSPTGADSYVYFGDDASDTAHYLTFDNSAQFFTFSNHIYALGHVYANSNLYAKGHLLLNYDNTAADSAVYFGDAASDTAHSLSFSNSTQKFTLTDDLIVAGDLTVNGTMTIVDTDVSTTEQLLITNDGTGPAVIINQTGSQPIMDVQDDGTSAFYIEDGGNVGIKTTNPTTTLQVAGRALANILSTTTADTRDKIRLYDTSAQYTIGMQSGVSYGGLNSDWAMTFQFNNDNDRGFWWGDEAHTTAQGAMALTTNGLLTVASKIRVGYGESDTTIPATYALDVNGNSFIDATSASATLTLGRYSGNPTIKAGTSAGGYLIMDSTSNYLSLNHYTSQNVVINNGGGKTGIGTTSPAYKLDVNGTARISSTVKMLAGTSYNENLRMSASTNGYSSIAFGADSSTDTGTQTGQWTLVRYPQATHNYKFAFRHSTSDVMTLLTDGKVGIGTGSPSTKVHISESGTSTALTVQNASTNGTVVKLTSTGDNRNLYLQTDHIYSDGNLYIGDNSYETLIRGSAVKLDTPNLYLNNNNLPADTDTSIYFGDDESDTAHRLYFDDSLQQFGLSNSIGVSGGVTATAVYINNTSGESILKFGPGIPSNDDAHIEWRGTSNSGTLRISTSDDSGTENIELGDYDSTGRGGTFTQWANFRRSAIDFNTDLRIYQSGLANSGTHDLLTLEGNIGDVTADPVKVAIKFKLQDTNNLTNEARISMATVNDTDYGENNEATNNLIFSTSSVGTLTDKMIITGPGNVGIGNTNPAEKLDVYGDIKGQEIVLSNSSNVEKARMIYDATSETIKFTFA